MANLTPDEFYQIKIESEFKNLLRSFASSLGVNAKEETLDAMARAIFSEKIKMTELVEVLNQMITDSEELFRRKGEAPKKLPPAADIIKLARTFAKRKKEAEEKAQKEIENKKLEKELSLAGEVLNRAVAKFGLENVIRFYHTWREISFGEGLLLSVIQSKESLERAMAINLAMNDLVAAKGDFEAALHIARTKSNAQGRSA